MCRQVAARCLTIAGCSLIGTVAPAHAQTAPTPVIAALVVNGQDQGTIVTMLGPDRTLVETGPLQAAGLIVPAAPRIELDGRTFVSAAGLAPAIHVAFDEVDVALRVTASPEAFLARRQLSLLGSTGAPAALDANSVVVNYAMQMSTGQTPRYSTEIGMRAAGALVRTTLASTTLGLTRGETTLTYDDRHRMTRWEAGDTLGASNWIGTTIAMAGVSVSREFSIEPTFRPQAPLTVTGSTAVPAAAEVYVNNQLVARTAVDPGTFELHDFVPPAGAGQVRVVLRDSFGREQEFTSSYYQSPDVLRRGLQQFRYSIGARRVDATGALGRYEGVAAAAEHRVGVTDWLTLGGSAALNGAVATGGTNVAVRLPFGDLETNVAASRKQGVTGLSSGLSYAYRSRQLSAGASMRYTSDQFRAQVFPYGGPHRFFGSASIDVLIGGRLTLGIRDLVESMTVGTTTQLVGLALSASLPFRANLSATVLRATDGSRPTEGLVMMTLPIGRNTSASVAYASDAMGPAMSAGVQRSLPLGPGIGYQFQARGNGDSSLGVAALQLKGGSGRVELRRDVSAAATPTDTVVVSGAVVAVGGTLHVSAPVRDAYALVRVPGVRGVRTYAANQYVGRTGRGGDLLVPDLASYNANHLAIDDRDVPLLFDVPRTEAVVAPALRGGGVVLFPVAALDAAEAQDASITPIPSSTARETVDAQTLPNDRIAQSMSRRLRESILRLWEVQ